MNRVTILCDKFSGHPKGYVACCILTLDSIVEPPISRTLELGIDVLFQEVSVYGSLKMLCLSGERTECCCLLMGHFCLLEKSVSGGSTTNFVGQRQ